MKSYLLVLCILMLAFSTVIHAMPWPEYAGGKTLVLSLGWFKRSVLPESDIGFHGEIPGVSSSYPVSARTIFHRHIW
jgi:hypothetical protein